MKVLIQKNIKVTFLEFLLIRLFVLVIGLLRESLFIEVKMQLMNLLMQFLNKNLIKITSTLILIFQQSNNCLICKKLIDNNE